jgi:hypothetical protein
MGQVMEYSGKSQDGTARCATGWGGAADVESWENEASPALNVRAVEFIARPGKCEQLQECLQGSVLEFLKKKKGFAGAVILSSHKEARLATVLSFWQTAGEATENHWENSRVIHQMLFHLIDVCSRVHTYEAAISVLPGFAKAQAGLLAC